MYMQFLCMFAVMREMLTGKSPRDKICQERPLKDISKFELGKFVQVCFELLFCI